MSNVIGLRVTQLRLPSAHARLSRTAYNRRPTNGGRTSFRVDASAQAARLLSQAKQKFEANDRMGALLLWEKALKDDETDNSQRITALYNSTCVHAAFGDVELAQITLREAVQRGLDFSKVMQDPGAFEDTLVKLVASQQVLVRLRKFDEATRRAMGAKASAPPTFSSSSSSSNRNSSSNSSGATAASSPSSSSIPRQQQQQQRRRSGGSMFDQDVSKMLETDMQGIDTSILGVVKRVAVLLLALTGLGVGLYLVGLQYLFPDI